MNAITSGLRADGYRFVRRGVQFLWVHPLEMRAGDLDTTDMTDDEFEQVVRGTEEVAA